VLVVLRIAADERESEWFFSRQGWLQAKQPDMIGPREGFIVVYQAFDTHFSYWMKIAARKVGNERLMVG
jgi:hypothetical protein